MLLIRFLLCAGMIRGAAFAGSQQFPEGDSSIQFVQPKAPSTLPAPMASAIQRLAKPGAMQRLTQIRNAQAALFLQKPCSIPLSEYKIPDNTKFAIRQLPLPKNAPDSMPVMTAPVCAAP